MSALRLLFLIVGVLVLLVNTSATNAQVINKRCSTSQYHEFDFWIGQWDTFDINDPTKVIARNRVERMTDGCAIREVYEQADGLVGESFSIYDLTRHVWHQSWVTNRGQLLTLEGGMSAGKMILTGNEITDGKPRLLRGIWSTQDGGVRETAEVSVNGGKTWTLLFDIMFRPAKTQQRSDTQDKDALISLENDWLRSEHDANALDRILAPDFVHPVVTGDLLTKTQHIYYSSKRLPPANLKQRFDQLNVRVYGDVGIVNGIVVTSDESGKEMDRTVFTDVFAYRGGRWQAVNAQENKVQKMETPRP